MLFFNTLKMFEGIVDYANNYLLDVNIVLNNVLVLYFNSHKTQITRKKIYIAKFIKIYFFITTNIV